MPNINIVGKHYLTKTDEEKLFESIVDIWEKIDGANVGFFRDDETIIPFKRSGYIDNSHKQYIFYQNWIRDKYNDLINISEHYIFYAELMRCKHSIEYNKLSDWVIIFDIFDKTENKYLSAIEMIKVCKMYNLKHAPYLGTEIISNKKQLLKYIKKESEFGNLSEGIMIKNNRNQLRGKIVKEEFIKLIDQFWRNKPIVYNKLKKWTK